MTGPRHPLKYKLTSLPAWAQVLIEDLQRQRDAAVRALDRLAGEHQDGFIEIRSFDCTGETSGAKTRTLKFSGHDVSMRTDGVVVRLTPREGGINITYSADDGETLILHPAYLRPSAYQQFDVFRELKR